MNTYIDQLAGYLEQLHGQKDQFLFQFVKPYWTRKIMPNHLTIARMIIGFLLFILLFNYKIATAVLILPLFFIGVTTDLLDGVVARAFNEETKLGKILDPLADRALILPVAIYSLFNNSLLLFVLLFFEIINALLSVLAQGKNIFFGSNIFGRTKMSVQSAVFLVILLFWPLPPSLGSIGILWLSAGLIVISVAQKFLIIKTYYEQKYKKHPAI